MTKNFEIADVKPGDIIIGRDWWETHKGVAPVAHTWIVLQNCYNDVRKVGYVDVYVLYSQSLLSDHYSFNYETFKRYQRVMDWRLKHVS